MDICELVDCGERWQFAKPATGLFWTGVDKKCFSCNIGDWLNLIEWKPKWHPNCRAILWEENPPVGNWAGRTDFIIIDILISWSYHDTLGWKQHILTWVWVVRGDVWSVQVLLEKLRDGRTTAGVGVLAHVIVEQSVGGGGRDQN